MSVLLALLSSVLWGGADFLGGLRARRLPALAVVAVSQGFGLLVVSLVAVGGVVANVGGPGGTGPGTDWVPWAAGAGVAGCTALVCFYRALAVGSMGVVSPIAALGALLPVLFGLLTGDRLTAPVAIGLCLALAGAVTTSLSAGAPHDPERRRAGASGTVGLAAVAGIGFGLTLVLIERGARSSTVLTLVGMRMVSVLMLAAVAVALRTTGGVRRSDLPALAVVGAADVGANLLFALASQRGLLSITAMLGSLYPVVTVLLARTVLHERLARIQLVGVAAALGGVVLVSWGRAG